MAQTGTIAEVPAVNINQFQVGASWTWDYLQDGQALYSSERYTVLNVNGAKVFIEMSSRLADETVYQPHQRFEAAIDRCREAYANPFTKKPWSISMYYKNGDDWTAYTVGTTLAFEEKFNCNSKVLDNSFTLTAFRDSAVGRLFSQLLYRTIQGSWYFNDGPDAGVAAEKIFPQPLQHFYLMRLHQELR